mmetsp:Transcript_3600/g.7871  ORF Transcript_3600/g.7871 Transcript_3600/m.7871 type:complete len:265 (-) Transcript_3600:394-1188(-)|eukprot:CAMPEP_0201125206 /NCGR_PEP_ID=MMETSP0850-20130426/19935_1 /ASSEMBLY_ACC=CAM_ASM_000622 /TAXON_ID=183588 /ORGANISM="Pseudo-nitzschia fraudulenta, Strain WWA7" /LENGTH=264 /DNA_ID=CAMNT_0047393089 /DNA_START=548 /DNA_END=1342 /DNA_ORIENTATION=-
MPSRESVSEAIRARSEFATAVKIGIDALMGRCGYSRERAANALLKELNRGTGPDNNGISSKPTDDEIFDAMRRHKLGLDDANRAITVSRAMRRELLSRNDSKITPAEAIQRLIGKISLDNILYESGEDDSDEDEEEKNEIISLKIPKISRVQSSSSVKISSSSSTSTSNTTTSTNHHSSRKNTRGKKNTNPSPRNQLKANHIKLVGRKRSIEDMDSNTANGDVQTKAANGRPQLRASKRLHRSSSASNEPSVTVSSGLNANTEI